MLWFGGNKRVVRVAFRDRERQTRLRPVNSWIVGYPDVGELGAEPSIPTFRSRAYILRHLRLTDPHLFDYPWIYATQTGWWGLSDAETRCLREYLLRGGYLVVDDFRGPEQWEIFRLTMDRVLPNRAIVDLAQSLYLDEVRGGMGWKTREE